MKRTFDRCTIGVVVFVFAACTATEAEPIKLSVEAETVLNDVAKIREEAFLDQTFFRKRPDVADRLARSGRNYSAELKADLADLIGGFIARLDASAAAAEKLGNRFERDYATAVIRFDQAKLYFEVVNDRRTAVMYLDKAAASGRSAVDARKRFADAYRLYGEIQNQYIPIRGGFAAIYFSGEARKAYQRALSIDGNHGRSLLAYGIWYLFAPEIAGGSTAKALDRIRRSRVNRNDRYLEFLAYVWESLALANAGSGTEAKRAIGQALNLAPENSWAVWIRRELDAGRRPLDSMQ